MKVCLALFFYLFVFGCSKDKGVTVYSSIDVNYAKEVLSSYQKRNIRLISDTEAAKSTGLINRLLTEKNRPVADVFISGDPMRTAFLEGEGIGEAYLDREIATRFRMLIVNKERESLASRPQVTLDLAQAQFAPNSCLANPQFGTTSMHLAVLLEQYGAERVKRFLREFIANGGKIVASNGEVKRRVGSGEFIYGLTDSDDVSVALRDGKPVDYVLLDQDSFGAISIPMTVVLIRNGPHPEKALELAEYLTSSKTEQVMAAGLAAHFPMLNPTQKPSAFGFSYSQVKVADLDYGKLSQALAQFQPWLDEWVAQNR